MIFETGRVCVKIAGRDAGNPCVVLKNVDDNYVLIDGLVRRKKVNKKHVEPINILVDVNKTSKTKTVLKALKEAELIGDEEAEKWLNKTPSKASKKPSKKSRKKSSKKKTKTKKKSEKKTKKKSKKSKKSSKKKKSKKSKSSKSSKKKTGKK